MDLIKSETPEDFSREYGKAWNVGSGDASKQEEVTLNKFCKCVLLNASHVPLPINSSNSITKGLRTHVHMNFLLCFGSEMRPLHLWTHLDTACIKQAITQLQIQKNIFFSLTGSQRHLNCPLRSNPFSSRHTMGSPQTLSLSISSPPLPDVVHLKGIHHHMFCHVISHAPTVLLSWNFINVQY